MKVQEVIGKISKKSVTNFRFKSVDGAFVLRVLLEYYRAEKMQNLKTLR